MLQPRNKSGSTRLSGESGPRALPCRDSMNAAVEGRVECGDSAFIHAQVP